MTTQSIIKSILCVCLLVFVSQSCVNDLDTTPLDPETATASNVFNDPDSYKAVLAKLYAGLAVSGQQGPAGQADIEGIDEGFGQYLRGYWYHQQLTTDEAVIGWNDQTIRDFHYQTWNADDGFIFAFYSRMFYQVVATNEFLRETTEAKLNERGVDAALAEEIRGFRAEARFLRALSYWHALDLFRNVPFVTENDPVGSFSLSKYLLRNFLLISNLNCLPLKMKLHLSGQMNTGVPTREQFGHYSRNCISTPKHISAHHDTQMH